MKNILILTTNKDPHAEEVIKYIDKKEFKVTQVLTDVFKESKILYTDKCFTYDGISIPDDVFSVWFRKPQLWIVDLEGKDVKYGLQMDYKKNENMYLIRGISYLTDRKDIFQVGNLHAISLASNKVYQFKVAQKLGFTIPPTIVTNQIPLLIDFENKYEQCVIKSFTNEAVYGEYFQSYMTYRLKKNFFANNYKNKTDRLDCNVFLQKEISKKFDIRVTVIGNKIFACSIDSQSHKKTITDFRVMDAHKIKHEIIDLPEDIKKKCFSLIKEFGLQYGAIDIIMDKEDNYIFLEINPNGQYLWIEEETKLPLSKTMADLLTNPPKNKLR